MLEAQRQNELNLDWDENAVCIFIEHLLEYSSVLITTYHYDLCLQHLPLDDIFVKMQNDNLLLQIFSDQPPFVAADLTNS